MPDVKNTILKKKIGNTVYDLMVKTITSMVYDGNGATLDSLLQTITGDVSDIQTALGTMLNNGEAFDIAQAIANGVSDAEGYADDLVDKTAMTTAGYQNVSAYIEGVKTELSGLISGAFHFKGTVNFEAGLPNPSDPTPANRPAEGDVYQIKYRTNPAIVAFKGSVDYVADLPASEQTAGDTYIVKYEGSTGSTELNHAFVWNATGAKWDDIGNIDWGAEFAFNGTAWVELGSIVDLSNYFTKSEVTSAIATAKTGAENTAQTYTDGLVGKTAMNAAGYNDAATWIATKSNIYVQTQQPANLTESDLWFYEIPANNSGGE